VCCAGGTWTHCDRYSKAIQVKRIEEARATEAETMVTACAKCRVHFGCAMRDPDVKTKGGIKMQDLAEFVAEALE
jgi:heterodisulfide reductase subunit D